jgi:DNA invertase Pin-like site-specific DNA recombinase
MKIGYARGSTVDQNLDRQIGALNAAGCEKIYREKASGASTKGRPELEKAIDALGGGDLFVIAEWDRATRSMNDGLHIIQRIADRGALVKVLDREWCDLTTPLGRGILAFLSAIAEDERERIVRRGKQGLEKARERGVKLGRKPKLSAHQRKVVSIGMQTGPLIGVQKGLLFLIRTRRKAGAAARDARWRRRPRLGWGKFGCGLGKVLGENVARRLV